MALFWRKKSPQGVTVNEQCAIGMRRMEEWYRDFVIWAYAYISLLEKQLEQVGKGCQECEYRKRQSGYADADKETMFRKAQDDA